MWWNADVAGPSIPAVDPADIPTTAVLLDVREDDEWTAGHAPHAVHVPMSRLVARIDEVPDAPVAVICKAGGRSAQVTAYLLQQGRDATNVTGGMLAWAAEGRPMTADVDAPARVL